MCQCVNVCFYFLPVHVCTYKCVQHVRAENTTHACLLLYLRLYQTTLRCEQNYLPWANVLQHTRLSIKSLFCSVIYSFFHLFDHPCILFIYLFICSFIHLFTPILPFNKFLGVFSSHCFMCQSVFCQCSKYHQPLSVAHLSWLCGISMTDMSEAGAVLGDFSW